MSEAVCPILSGTDGCGPVPQVCDDPGPSLATVLLVSLLVALVGLAASAPRRRHDRAAHAPERQHDP